MTTLATRKQLHCWAKAQRHIMSPAYVVIAYKDLVVTLSTPKGSSLKWSEIITLDLKIIPAFISSITTEGSRVSF